jgi:hypothetical protein
MFRQAAAALLKTGAAKQYFQEVAYEPVKFKEEPEIFL